MIDSKTKKRKGPKMTLRFADPRDDRTGGTDYDDLEENVPSTGDNSHPKKSAQKNQS